MHFAALVVGEDVEGQLAPYGREASRWRRWDYWSFSELGEILVAKPDGAVVPAELACRAETPPPGGWRRPAAGQVLRGCQARARDVDFAAMNRIAREDAGRTWDTWRDMTRAGRRDELYERVVGGFSREQYLARAGSWHLPYLVADGDWHERGDLGLRADVDDERAREWVVFVDRLIARLADDTLLSVVDCHA
jgi:hypothetical protein